MSGSSSSKKADVCESGSADENIQKLNPITLGAHDSSQSQTSSAKQYVGSWITAQNEFVKDSEKTGTQDSLQNTCTATPAILLTDVDEDDTTPTELVSAQDRVFSSKRAGRRNSFEVRMSPRKVSMLPTTLNQTILEEPEEGEENDGEDEFMEAQEGGSQILRLKTDVSTSVQVDEDLLVGINTRQRAKSYPSQVTPAPMLELPRENVPNQTQQSGTDTTEHTGLRKFAQVAIMAKKWKKRSADCEDEVIANTLESVALRQKKRPFVPRSFKVEILEDAYPIVQKTYQLYKSYLGPRHKLTLLAEKHLEDLSLQLEK